VAGRSATPARSPKSTVQGWRRSGSRRGNRPDPCRRGSGCAAIVRAHRPS
jgi:hypothetical protein